jgi:hypothetical protein
MWDPTVVMEVASLAAVVPTEGIALEAAPGRVQRLRRVNPTGRMPVGPLLVGLVPTEEMWGKLG